MRTTFEILGVVAWLAAVWVCVYDWEDVRDEMASWMLGDGGENSGGKYFSVKN